MVRRFGALARVPPYQTTVARHEDPTPFGRVSSTTHISVNEFAFSRSILLAFPSGQGVLRRFSAPAYMEASDERQHEDGE